MKIRLHHFSRLLFSLALVTLVFSCKKDKNEEPEETQKTKIEHPIIGKWNITKEGSPYLSFEFNKDGNYIVVESKSSTEGKLNVDTGIKSSLFNRNGISLSENAKSNLSPVHFGTFKIEGDKITLSGFGLIDIVTLTEEEFHFSFTIQSTGEKFEYTADRTKEAISSSSKTEMLCRTWAIERVSVDLDKFDEEEIEIYEITHGENWHEVITASFNEAYKGGIILFSKAGTYMNYKEGESAAAMAEWKWVSEEEKAFYYSWDNWQGEWEKSIAQISEISSTRLVIDDVYFTFYLKLK